jgi:hypothetical protein
MEQDLKLLRKTSTGNSWRNHRRAPKYLIQNLKRSREDIGRDVAKMFCKAESLKKLNFTDVQKLLIKYREVFEPEDSMWTTLSKALENMEANKADISRVGMVQSCFSLSVENKALSAKAMDVILTTRIRHMNSNYQLKLPRELNR